MVSGRERNAVDKYLLPPSRRLISEGYQVLWGSNERVASIVGYDLSGLPATREGYLVLGDKGVRGSQSGLERGAKRRGRQKAANKGRRRRSTLSAKGDRPAMAVRACEVELLWPTSRSHPNICRRPTITPASCSHHRQPKLKLRCDKLAIYAR